MAATIRTVTDERNHHAVVVTIGNDSRIFFRADTASVAGAEVIGFDALPVAQYHTTKAGKRLLLAE